MRMDGRTDGQTDMKLIITFWNCFANAPRRFLRQQRIPHREHNPVTVVVVMATIVTIHTKGTCQSQQTVSYVGI